MDHWRCVGLALGKRISIERFGGLGSDDGSGAAGGHRHDAHSVDELIVADQEGRRHHERRATIYASRHTWPISTTAHLRKVEGRWLITRSTVTTF